eukprot:CAMPEP_0204841306 /NCGR_PEP_ID=MMETSP1346-20131115/41379_1 /ASSEMBLY_ACC=CAM_ASM_000771 /TAXON_ID=215587 /ORGANISM="Aplanochytrium stocchinoi, Strain GSBS06" /LENGTH=216 /DNA_ID=CAMNT_0051979339 /DNA_START=410 /DNA_END=1061 /DNA_ORIENTATION=+
MASIIEQKLTLSLDEISKLNKKENNKNPKSKTKENPKKLKFNKVLFKKGKVGNNVGSTKGSFKGRNIVAKKKQNTKPKDLAAKTIANLKKGQHKRQLAIQKKRKIGITNTNAKAKKIQNQNPTKKSTKSNQKNTKKQSMKVKPNNIKVTITNKPIKVGKGKASSKLKKEVKLVQPTAGGETQNRPKPKQKQVVTNGGGKQDSKTKIELKTEAYQDL